MSDPLQRLAAIAGTLSSSALRVLLELTAKPDQPHARTPSPSASAPASSMT